MVEAVETGRRPFRRSNGDDGQRRQSRQFFSVASRQREYLTCVVCGWPIQLTNNVLKPLRHTTPKKWILGMQTFS